MHLTDPRNGRRALLDRDLSDLWAREFAGWTRQEWDYERSELRRGTHKGGAPAVRNRCLGCGELCGNPAERPPNAAELKNFDLALQAQHDAVRNAAKAKPDEKYIEIQVRRWRGKERGDSCCRQTHDAYLARPEWEERRRLVGDRARGPCEGCRRAPPTEVHHPSHEHWGHEFLFELVALFGDCHDRIHAKGDREALVDGCRACLHASRSSFCRLFDMPMPMALDPEGPCKPEREGLEPVP